MQSKQRIDLYLLENNYCQTRSQAQQMIDFGLVKINQQVINKSNYLIKTTDSLEVEPLKYVSRAGIKLATALKEFKIDVNDKVILDIGASTGGFTDCCLQLGAKLVYALDVGTNQLAEKLKSNPKVINLEQVNLKDLPNIKFNDVIDIIVCDVSFISLKHVFTSLKNLRNDKLIMVFLIKPQFELDQKTINQTKGIIKNPKHHQLAIDKVKEYAIQNNFELKQIINSPILGKKGENKEFIGYFQCKK